jgi:hypothetical protein
MRQTPQQKQIDRTVEAAYYRACNGIQIDIMDIGKVFAAGRQAIAAGKQGADLDTAIRAYVETIRKN